MTGWLTQDFFATLVALGAAATVVRHVLAFVRPARGRAGCPSCPTPGAGCTVPAPHPAAESPTPPLIQIRRTS